MQTIEIIGEVDDQHQLHAEVPEGVPAGSVRVIVITQDEDDAGRAWVSGLRAEWSDDLADPSQDIYTLEDGQPINEAR